jgi:hypothetical protein
VTRGRVSFLGGPFDGLETAVKECDHGNMPDVNLCVRVVEPTIWSIIPPDLRDWPTVFDMMTTTESAAAWSRRGVDAVYDVARYGWHDEAEMYVYAETVRRELHPEHDREDDR